MFEGNDRLISAMENAIERCEIYLGERLVSDNDIYRRYMRFLFAYKKSSQKGMDKPIYTSTLHGDSLLAGIILFTALRSYVLNKFSVQDSMHDLQLDDIVVYKKERCRYLGIDTISGQEYIRIEGGSKCVTLVPQDRWNEIALYNKGDAKLGRGGMRRAANPPERQAFFAELLGESKEAVVAELNTLSLVLADIDRVDAILNNMFVRLKGGNRKPVKFLKLFTVAKVSSTGKISNYPGNVTHGTANIEICATLPILARRLDEYERNEFYQVTSFYVDDDRIVAANLEMIKSLIDAKVSLKVLDVHYDFVLAQKLMDYQNPARRIIVTPSLKLKPSVKSLDCVLYSEWKSLVNGKVTAHSVTIDYRWADYQRLYNKLKELVRDNNLPVAARQFCLNSFGFIKQILNSVENLSSDMCTEYYSGRLSGLEEVTRDFAGYQLGDNMKALHADLTALWKTISAKSPKHHALTEVLERYAAGRKIIVVTPKKRLVDYINNASATYRERSGSDIVACMPKKFSSMGHFDVLILTGRMDLEELSLFSHVHADKTIALLYDFEYPWWNHMVELYKKALHSMATVKEYASFAVDERLLTEKSPYDDAYVDDGLELEKGLVLRWEQELPQMLAVGMKSAGDDGDTEVVACITLDSGLVFLVSSDKYPLYVIDDVAGKLVPQTINEVSSGDSFLYCQDFGNRESLLKTMMRLLGEDIDKFNDALILTHEWKKLLQSVQGHRKLNTSQLTKRLNEAGAKVDAATVRSWLNDTVIGPNDEKSYRAIAEVIADESDANTWERYYEATRLVRRTHKKITNDLTAYIRGIYMDYRRGKTVSAERKLEYELYEKMDELAIPLTVDHVVRFRRSVSVRNSLVNRPIDLEED